MLAFRFMALAKTNPWNPLGWQLHWQILAGMFLGAVFGLFGGGAVGYVDWIGTAFLRLLMMIIVPLIVTSIITGVTGQKSAKDLGSLGLKTLIYYFTTSILAILAGLIIVNIVQPGVGANLALEETPDQVRTVQSFQDIVLELIPRNMVDAMVRGDMLQVIFFCLLLGIVILHLKDPGRGRLADLFHYLFDAMMTMTHWIMRAAPLGVFAIVARVVQQNVGNFWDPDSLDRLSNLAGTMGTYMGCVASGLAIHALITLPLILYTIGRVNPRRYAGAMSPALLTAFSTASSSATLPLTMRCAEKNAGVSNRVVSFVLPLGATVNMDGTALYECVAAIFIAQVYGIQLTFTQQMIVVFTALLASIGAAGVPMAGFVTIAIILRALGLPEEGVGLILSVDRILDMMRTSVNVWSDSTGTATLARLEGEKISIRN